MALDADLAALMVDTVGLELYQSRDLFGAATYGPLGSFKCRIEPVNQKVFAAAGNGEVVERVASSRIYLAEAPVVGVNDRITLPDGSQPRILAVEANGDERGAHHQVVIT